MRNLRKLDLQNSKNDYLVSVAVALLIVSILLAYFFVFDLPETEGYMSISLLDSQKKAANYPEFLFNGVNSTFSVYVEISNNMGDKMNAQVRVSAAQVINPSAPVYTAVYNGTVENKMTWEEIATFSLNEPGNYSVFFELWVDKQNAGLFEFNNEYCVLNVQVVQ